VLERILFLILIDDFNIILKFADDAKLCGPAKTDSGGFELFDEMVGGLANAV